MAAAEVAPQVNRSAGPMDDAVSDLLSGTPAVADPILGGQKLQDGNPDVDATLVQNTELMNKASQLVTEPPAMEDEDPITQEMIDEVLKPILEFPRDLMSDEIAEMLGVVQASDEKHKDMNAIGLARVQAEQKEVADLEAELTGPVDDLKAILEDRRAALERRRAKLEQRKAKPSAKEQFDAHKEKSLVFNKKITDQYISGDQRNEKINSLEQQIAQLYHDMENDQHEQNAYLNKSRDLLRAATNNRTLMVDRMNNEVLPSLRQDASALKQSIQSLTDKNTELITEGRRQLMDKKDQISLVVDGQTAKIRGLQYTLQVLRTENAQLETVKRAQEKQRTDNTLRLRRLKEGVILDKFHSHRPGKMVKRWLQLSEDGNFLYYAADMNLKKKFKKIRVSEIADVFLGPCTATFNNLRLYVSPTNVFSLVLKEGSSIDMHCERQDSLEAVFLGLMDLTQLYDASRLPVFTISKLRWMRYCIRAMLPRGEDVTLDDFNIRRQYLRRMFGYRYYESRFERLQAKMEEQMHDAREIFLEETKVIRENKHMLVDGEDLMPALPGQEGLVSDNIRKDLNRNSFINLSRAAALTHNT